MHVIPVIDVRNGVAVRAVAGDRATYRPLVSPLCPGSEPASVASGLMALHPFPVIYLADLDGIEGRGANLELVRELAGLTGNGGRGDASPVRPGPDGSGDHAARRVSQGVSNRPADRTLWVDNGAMTMAGVSELCVIPSTDIVVGSETGIRPHALRDLEAQFPGRLILSLDFRADGFMGDPALLAEPASWPERVIVMTLAQVGGQGGPDLARIAAITQRAGRRLVYAAGGIRNRADLEAAARAGATGALVSTALHARTLTVSDLDAVANP